jgi:hypothetical protein
MDHVSVDLSVRRTPHELRVNGSLPFRVEATPERIVVGQGDDELAVVRAPATALVEVTRS